MMRSSSRTKISHRRRSGYSARAASRQAAIALAHGRQAKAEGRARTEFYDQLRIAAWRCKNRVLARAVVAISVGSTLSFGACMSVSGYSTPTKMSSAKSGTGGQSVHTQSRMSGGSSRCSWAYATDSWIRASQSAISPGARPRRRGTRRIASAAR